MKKTIILLSVLCFSLLPLRADEGMWMVNAISRALAQKMEAQGLQLEANEIYDEDKLSLKDAIVSLDFGCTASMISADGLLITNHHCAYSDVHSLSTAEHNYLEEGFFAASRADEIPIKGKKAYFLRKVLDVTDEVKDLIESEKAAGRPYGSRRISSLINKKYSTATGYEADLSSMWAGEHYYLALYEVYSDLRLVAAPPVSIAAFGGDIDNWEWPQQKCDFAIYRIYTDREGKGATYSEENIPMHPRKYLTISTQGVNSGDFTMILGYPGRTARYSSSAKVKYRSSTVLPISNEIRSKQMSIIKEWMDKDPEIRLKYSDKFFSLSNIQENDEGFVQNVKRFKAVKHIRREEKRTMRQYRALLNSLDSNYTAVCEAESDRTYFRETIVRGTGLSLVATRLRTKTRNPRIEEHYATLDMRLEKDLFRYSVEQFFEGVSPSAWGPYQRELLERFGSDYDAMTSFLWKEGIMTTDDPIYKFYSDLTIVNFNARVDSVLNGKSLSSLDRDYTRAKHRVRESRGIIQYPDANSTMRLSYGQVNSFKRSGRLMPIHTWASEILAKEDSSSYDFRLIPEWKEMLKQTVDSGEDLPVNFISDNDITGGNSGSPVLNARGEIIGLAFDGNKESLASDVYWTPGYNKCINVDIRFVLWTLKNFAKMDYILDEINIK